MDVLVIILALAALMIIAYRGYSVILFAPVVALGAVCYFQPLAVLPSYVSLFMTKVGFFFATYFPIFLFGAIFGKVIELAGFSKAICAKIFAISGEKHTIMAIALVSGILAYSGVSAFVIVFAIYPFAAELFRMGNIPKRLIPCTIILGGLTFTMDALPGTPQIQNLIPTTFFGTTAYSAPILGCVGSIFILFFGLLMIHFYVRRAKARGEGYDSGWALVNEPEPYEDEKLPSFWLALIPLVTVAIVNYAMTKNMVSIFGTKFVLDLPGLKPPMEINVAANASMWAVLVALFAGIIMTVVLGHKMVLARFAEGTKSAISGCLLAIVNTASEYGYGSIIATLPGFLYLATHMQGFPEPLIGEIVSVTTLAGIVGSSSGGLSIAMGSMADIFISNATAVGIPMEVVHRIASMASGGMDSLPHNGAVITILAVTGLTHRQAYLPILGVTLIKTIAVFFVVLVYYVTGLY